MSKKEILNKICWNKGFLKAWKRYKDRKCSECEPAKE
jgi:hypothetical protein